MLTEQRVPEWDQEVIGEDGNAVWEEAVLDVVTSDPASGHALHLDVSVTTACPADLAALHQRARRDGRGAADAAAELYGYGHGHVLFKPTKATKHPFRPTGADAMSYFVGAEAMENDKFKGEDAGFAINGGKGWKNVEFNNHQINLNGPVAFAMGSYDFTCATTGEVTELNQVKSLGCSLERVGNLALFQTERNILEHRHVRKEGV